MLADRIRTLDARLQTVKAKYAGRTAPLALQHAEREIARARSILGAGYLGVCRGFLDVADRTLTQLESW